MDIKSTQDWFVASGQMQPVGTQPPDAKMAAFYLGMQLEELGEKMTLVFGATASGLITLMEALMETVGEELKLGMHVDRVQAAMQSHPEEMLDGDMDLIWVSIGAAQAQGGNPSGAYSEVRRANWDKFPGGVPTRHPDTGKVMKPEGWRGPDLTPFVHPTLLSTVAGAPTEEI